MSRSKLVITRFPGKCNRCGERINAGERAYWAKGSGLMHPECPSREPAKLEMPKRQAGFLEMTFSYSEIREAFKLMATQMDANREKVMPGNLESARDLDIHNWQRSGWVGISIAEMQDFIDHGYRVIGMEGIESLIPARPRRKLNYAEEGDEMLLDLVWSGDDNAFQTWEKRNVKPGLSVEIHMVFGSIVNADIVNAYQRWIAQALQTLDENHIDMEIVIVTNTAGADLLNPGASHSTRIKVREAGQASDFSNWSPMFSPGGYRMLGIMACGMHVSARNGRIAAGFGNAVPYGKFTVDYDESRNVMVIGNGSGSSDFPEFEMTEKLRAILVKLSG